MALAITQKPKSVSLFNMQMMKKQKQDPWEPCMILATNKKMLENRPEDALGSLVKTVETERRILKYLIL